MEGVTRWPRSFVSSYEALLWTPHGEEFQATILAFQLGQNDTSDEVDVNAFDVNEATISIHAASHQRYLINTSYGSDSVYKRSSVSVEHLPRH